MGVRPHNKLQAIFEYGSKYVKVAVVIENDLFKWAFIDHKTGLPHHEYEGKCRSVIECLVEIDKLLSPVNRTRVL